MHYTVYGPTTILPATANLTLCAPRATYWRNNAKKRASLMIILFFLYLRARTSLDNRKSCLSSLLPRLLGLLPLARTNELILMRVCPRRAWAARVAVLVLCVSVCLSAAILALQACFDGL